MLERDIRGWRVMLTECYSFGGKCPCLECEKSCCLHKKTDTEKLCDEAREYCEKVALEHQKKSEVTDNE